MAAIEWKIPCELCGGRDVETQAAWPADNHPKGRSHESVVVHWNDDRCYLARGHVPARAGASPGSAACPTSGARSGARGRGAAQAARGRPKLASKGRAPRKHR
jgi:hypothetical protein